MMRHLLKMLLAQQLAPTNKIDFASTKTSQSVYAVLISPSNRDHWQGALQEIVQVNAGKPGFQSQFSLAVGTLQQSIPNCQVAKDFHKAWGEFLSLSRGLLT